MPRLIWRFQVACLVLTVFAAAGCADDPTADRPPLHSAVGKLTVAGRPAEGVTLNFHPLNSGAPTQYVPSAATNRAGEFQIGTFEAGDGAPEGEYIVTATWWNSTGEGDDAGQEDRLKGRYADHATSKLRVKIVPGGGSLPPLRLK